MVEDMGSILQKVGFFFCHWQSHKQYILSFPVFVIPRWKWNRCKTQLDNMHYGNFFECNCKYIKRLVPTGDNSIFKNINIFTFFRQGVFFASAKQNLLYKSTNIVQKKIMIKSFIFYIIPQVWRTNMRPIGATFGAKVIAIFQTFNGRQL